ncbi:hypothetical protein ABXJ76_05595 [Methylobacter sp. G7]|uniref:hypothetical protein n=1 Tax=Methylobacter sp. G7 TaxID=3230117 RepID=UPI003D806BC1
MTGFAILGDLPPFGTNDVIEMIDEIVRYDIVTFESAGQGKTYLRVVKHKDFATFKGVMYQIDRGEEEETFQLRQVRMQFWPCDNEAARTNPQRLSSTLEPLNMNRDRLTEIVEFAYARLREKINGGSICVENEASLQLHLSSILKTFGELYESSKNEVFSIELEKPVTLSGGRFEKSGTRKAKIDIWISIENLETKTKHSCAIELKYFKFANHREPNNRYDVFSDIQNLESYGDFADLCFLIVATDHPHYVNQENYSQDTADFDFRHGKSYHAEAVLTYKTKKPYGDPISLGNSYSFVWDEFSGGVHFLKLSVIPRSSSNLTFERDCPEAGSPSI